MANKQTLDEASKIIYQTILEKFGRPIGDSPSTVGVPDERHLIDDQKKKKD